ncbi:hypothetical protein B0T44_03310 [Nocardia donostiensis]|uniref:Uncharacterized protein n=2 Tax=Nocardia donostiensis TaxID=1538463 RepID=A0A1V2TGI9_9NOCA|nr:hypothetical protein B0T46_11310 [Nocardia donostiensis]OQS16815.1 hypothetical protein B0T36_03985 [Nocardia donostiensis]OQS23281.1 hypothetical protein B0T44_03310 [Nocardia donostiensis]
MPLVGDNTDMAQLWVRTLAGDWLRAAAIDEIGTAPVRETDERAGPTRNIREVEVVARQNTTAGSWSWDHHRGTGEIGPVTRTLARYASAETAAEVAQRLVEILLSANKNAQILIEGTDINVIPVHDRTDSQSNGEHTDLRRGRT